jgi:serine/threonine protein kinase
MLESNESGVLRKSESATPKDKKVNYFVLEFAPNGELYDYVACIGAFPEPIARFYFKQIIDALTTIHKAGFAHRDLRPENLLLGKDFTLKIADFDLSCRKPIKRYNGTPSCLPPEVNERRNFDNDKVDLYSSSIIAFILVTGKRPFKKASYGDTKFEMIMHEDWAAFWEAHAATMSESFKHFIEKTLCYDSAKRLTMSEIKQCEWFNGVTAGVAEVVAFMTAGEDSGSEGSCSDSDDCSNPTMLLLPGGDDDEQEQQAEQAKTCAAVMQGKHGLTGTNGDDRKEKRTNASSHQNQNSDSSSSHGGCSSSGDDSSWTDDREDDSIFGFSLTGLF